MPIMMTHLVIVDKLCTLLGTAFSRAGERIGFRGFERKVEIIKRWRVLNPERGWSDQIAPYKICVLVGERRVPAERTNVQFFVEPRERKAKASMLSQH